jgi:hypothetical protein
MHIAQNTALANIMGLPKPGLCSELIVATIKLSARVTS